jgi:hypothetical protein
MFVYQENRDESSIGTGYSPTGCFPAGREENMGSRIYPPLRCEECGDTARLIAVCEKPDADTETRFYECSNPLCRDSFRSCVPILRERGWIGLRDELDELDVVIPH